MIHADPWDEVPRLEALLEADLRVQRERARARVSAESFCRDTCRVDGRCRLGEVIPHRERCPLWWYVRSLPAQA